MKPWRRRSSLDWIAPFGRRIRRGGGHHVAEPRRRLLVAPSGGSRRSDSRRRSVAVEVEKRGAEMEAPDEVPSVSHWSGWPGGGEGREGRIPGGRPSETEKGGHAAPATGDTRSHGRHRLHPSSRDRCRGKQRSTEGREGEGDGRAAAAPPERIIKTVSAANKRSWTVDKVSTSSLLI